MHIIWIIIIGALAGFIAKLISPSPNNPQGFILTTGPGDHWQRRRQLSRSSRGSVWS
jgi:hypothetical protein